MGIGRFKGFHILGSLIAVAVMTFAGWLLWRNLRQYDAASLMSGLAALEASQILLAVLCVVGSYASLTLFDVLALRHIGWRLPYRRVALASFTALSIGHTVGFAGLGSGALRLRFYTGWGLRATEVARVVLFCGLTVVIGILTSAAVVLTIWPHHAAASLHVSVPLLRAAGAGCLTLLAAYLIFTAFGPFSISIRHMKVKAPRLGTAAAQMAVGGLNYAFVAAALYQLLRVTGDVSYLQTVAVYIAALLMSWVSHAPGGLGVLEAVVLALVPSVETFGALLVFRGVYFLLPLVLGLMLLGVIELARRQGRLGFAEAVERPVP